MMQTKLNCINIWLQKGFPYVCSNKGEEEAVSVHGATTNTH